MWLGTGDNGSSSSELEPLDDCFSRDDLFELSESIRVRLRGAMVLEDNDRWPLFRNENDLFITTDYAFGEGPIVDRVHYVGWNDELGWYGNFDDDVVVSKRDLQNKRFRLRVKIYDLNKVSKARRDEIKKLATTPAGAFPQLAPYAGNADHAADTLATVVNDIDRHDRILDRATTLEVKEPNTGHRLLQPGYFVCTKEDVRGRELSLDDDLRLVEGIGNDGVEYMDGSYAVFQIDKNVERPRKMEIDQKVATLLAQLTGKGRSAETDLHHLRETLEAYTTLQKLDRVRELRSRSDRTSAEDELLEELQSQDDLQPYLRRVPATDG